MRKRTNQILRMLAALVNICIKLYSTCGQHVAINKGYTNGDLLFYICLNRRPYDTTMFTAGDYFLLALQIKHRLESCCIAAPCGSSKDTSQLSMYIARLGRNCQLVRQYKYDLLSHARDIQTNGISTEVVYQQVVLNAS